MKAKKSNPMLAVLAAGVANVVIFAAKLVVALLSGSAALMAEAVHSLVDTLDQALLFFGDRRSKRKADSMHPFGYGREKYFYAMIVGTLLFLVGGVYAIYHGVRILMAGGEGASEVSIFVSAGLLVFAMIIEGTSLAASIKIAKSQPSRPARSKFHSPLAKILRFVHRTKSAELIICLLEDTAAVTGAGIALVGVLLAYFTGDSTYDVVASIFVGVLLTGVGLLILYETKSLLLGEASDSGLVDLVAKTIGETDGVDTLMELKMINIAPEEILVLTKIDLWSRADPEDTINLIERRIRALDASVRFYIYVEVDDKK